MRANRRRDTGPELALRSALHRAGLRFRTDVQMVIGGVRVRPDILFTRRKLAVFVDGCFWHGCPQHGEMPVANYEFWRLKIDETRERDLRQSTALESDGWIVLRVWEHERVHDVVARIHALVAANGP
jgi:DNA mismatch endonuclease, patch repair protein